MLSVLQKYCQSFFPLIYVLYNLRVKRTKREQLPDALFLSFAEFLIFLQDAEDHLSLVLLEEGQVQDFCCLRHGTSDVQSLCLITGAPIIRLAGGYIQ